MATLSVTDIVNLPIVSETIKIISLSKETHYCRTTTKVHVMKP